MLNTLIVTHDLKVIEGKEIPEDLFSHPDYKFIWVDLQTTYKERCFEILTKLNCHPLAITDAMRDRHPPKIEAFTDDVFLLFKVISSSNGILDFNYQQFSLFVSEKVLITVHQSHYPHIDTLKSILKEKPQLSHPSDISIDLMHLASGDYLDAIFEFEEVLEAIEDDIHSFNNDRRMLDLVSFKSDLIKINRTFNYHKSISNQLLLHKDGIIHKLYSKDVHKVIDFNDRCERLFSLNDMYYKICTDLLDGYLSISSHQLNNTMKVLTVITAIFIPLGFLTGLYGMNFEYMPELKISWGYPALLFVMLTMVSSLLLFFKKKKWI